MSENRETEVSFFQKYFSPKNGKWDLKNQHNPPNNKIKQKTNLHKF